MDTLVSMKVFRHVVEVGSFVGDGWQEWSLSDQANRPSYEKNGYILDVAAKQDNLDPTQVLLSLCMITR